MSLLSLPKLQVLNLSNNRLGGPFPALQELAQLNISPSVSIDLTNNLFYGTVSTDLASLPVRSMRTDQNCIEFVGPEADFQNTDNFTGFGTQEPLATCLAKIQLEMLAGRWQEFDPTPMPIDSTPVSSVTDFQSATALPSFPLTSIPALTTNDPNNPSTVDILQTSEIIVLPETRANFISAFPELLQPPFLHRTQAVVPTRNLD
ncbi:hypothetical protein BC829DRAFT_92193 [Chytridium lagenaria]|nr:hypothetical protein BC829DRAFT_92193 [Chytridium lagenaria]